MQDNRREIKTKERRRAQTLASDKPSSGCSRSRSETETHEEVRGKQTHLGKRRIKESCCGGGEGGSDGDGDGEDDGNRREETTDPYSSLPHNRMRSSSYGLHADRRGTETAWGRSGRDQEGIEETPAGSPTGPITDPARTTDG